uniref:NADPH:quinone reductase and related Zn-dependent oxidoreductases n=1 Tax=uncultured Acidobacteriales bacterium HF0200_23L05 TaxID=710732 RepID=E0XUK3_9BACT|nr:NADPH:quinone reductase and related Zn-dependent oxidoreductases [uncultured Acidobacteriales bacterium HF0200_23L05]
MTHAVRIHSNGGPEVLQWEKVEVPDPNAGDVVVRQIAAGLNFIDVYFRTGLYKVPAFPSAIGNEGAGVVEAVGDGVTEVAVGDRVAYCMSLGSYTQRRLIPAKQLVKIPKGISEQQAAAVMLKGCTVQYLIRQTYPVQKGETVLFHAAAGGCGLIACQWLKHLGVRVIGTVGTAEKAELAKSHGCDHPIVYTEDNFVDRVKELTDGRGVPVVYDSVGKDTFNDSLECLQPRGLMVSFGNASGAVEPFAPALLAAKGSLFLTRPTLATYTATRADLEKTTADLFGVLSSGAVTVEVNQTYPLENAAQAHRDLEARKTTGSTILLTGV